MRIKRVQSDHRNRYVCGERGESEICAVGLGLTGIYLLHLQERKMVDSTTNQPKPVPPIIWVAGIILLGFFMLRNENSSGQRNSALSQSNTTVNTPNAPIQKGLTEDELRVARIVESSPYAEKELRIGFLKQDLQTLSNQLNYVYNSPSSRGATMNPYIAQRESLRRDSSINSIQRKIDWVNSEIARIESEIGNAKQADQQKFRGAFDSYEAKKYGQ